MSKPMPACEIIASLRLPQPVRAVAAIAKALAKEYGNDVLMWEEPRGMLNFGKPISEPNDQAQ